MMDAQTLDDNADYVMVGVEVATSRNDHLIDEEIAAVEIITGKNLRLEQEHIPQAYAVAKLKHKLTDMV
jgi:hypothetical protein